MTSAEIVAAILAILAGIGGFVKVFGDVTKLRSEAAAAKTQADAAAEATRETAEAAATKDEMQTARQLIEALQADNIRLREQLRLMEEQLRRGDDYWRRRVDELQAEVSRLRMVMRECGVDPDMPVGTKKNSHEPGGAG